MRALEDSITMEKLLIIRNNLSEISRLAVFVQEIAEELSLKPDVVYELNLVLEEAVSNVINYAYPDSAESEIFLSAVNDGARLVFTLIDSGLPFDPTNFPDADVTLSVKDRQIGGLGIFLIRKIMDDMQYKRVEGKNILTLVKLL